MMRKLVPLVDPLRINDYLAAGVDALLLGTCLGATRQPRYYTVEAMGVIAQSIPVIAVYNRFYFEPDIELITAELDALSKQGINEILCSDLGIVQLIIENDWGFKIILDTDTTMTNHYDIQFYLDHGVDEVIVSRELTLDERIEISRHVTSVGMHFFGYQLMSFSRRRHLSHYSDFLNLDLDLSQKYWIKEVKRDERYLMFEDDYGTHIYAPDCLSGIHAYPLIQKAGYQSLIFDVMGLDIEVVLAVCIRLDDVIDYNQFEHDIARQHQVQLGHGLWYQKTNQGK